MGFLDDLRAQVKDGSFRPLPVRQRLIPKGHGSGKLRSLGIPTIADPGGPGCVEAGAGDDLAPRWRLVISYGFRPKRQQVTTRSLGSSCSAPTVAVVLDADIEACFDRISHSGLLDRVQAGSKTNGSWRW